jgi:hypothetical protein
MAVTSTINVNVNTKQAQQSAKDLDKSIKGVGDRTHSLRAELRQMKEALLEMDEGSKEFQELAFNAAQLQDAIGDVSARVRVLASDTLRLDQGVQITQGLVGAFGAAQGAVALFGVENNALMKTMVKLQAIQNVTNGITQVANMLNKDSAAGILIRDIGTKALTVSQNLLSTATIRGGLAAKAASVGQAILNAVMNANPVFLLITGITALAGVMYMFSDSNEEAAKTQDELNKIMEENNKKVEDAINLQKELNALRTGGTIDQENQIKLMRAFGATQEQIFEAEKQLLLDRVKLLEDISFTRGKLTAEEEKERKDLYTQLQLLQTNFNNWEKDEAKKQDEKLSAERKKRQDEALKRQEEYNKKLLAFFDALEADRQKRITDDREKELQEAANRYDDLTALADAAGQDTTAITEQYRKDIQAINLKYDDLARKSEEEKVNERRTTNAALKVLDVELRIQEELNTATTEEKKKEIRKNYAIQLRDAKIAEVKTLRDIELSNTKLTEEQRQKIIADSNLKIAQLNGEAIDDMAETTKKTIQQTIDEISQITSQVFGGINNLLGALSESMRLQQEQLAYERDLQYQSEQAALENLLAQNIISREEYDAKTAEMNQQKAMEERAARRKAFNDEKKLRMASAGMAMAQAILNGLATQPLVPLGIIMAALAAVTGGIQLSNIKNQQFTAARGGVVPGSGPSHIDSVPSMLAPGEMVINSQSASMFPQTLSQINQMGGGIALTPDIPQKTTSGGNQKVYQENKEAQRVYVLETDITRSQKRVTRIEDIASF